MPVNAVQIRYDPESALIIRLFPAFFFYHHIKEKPRTDEGRNLHQEYPWHMEMAKVMRADATDVVARDFEF